MVASAAGSGYLNKICEGAREESPGRTCDIRILAGLRSQKDRCPAEEEPI